MSITKLQNLKAIHNKRPKGVPGSCVVVNHKTTKFESNSQRPSFLMSQPPGCCQSQNYKIWKQFTTPSTRFQFFQSLLSITKLQNLKAIHNLFPNLLIRLGVVVNHKTTKFESNSQPSSSINDFPVRCCQSQNYKIWKQFTTSSKVPFWVLKLLSITKLQNLKAIHNTFADSIARIKVVVNHKTTKFESNSQLKYTVDLFVLRCCQSQNYKIWKQFTTH